MTNDKMHLKALVIFVMGALPSPTNLDESYKIHIKHKPKKINMYQK
jgi:hypothetical protein